MGGNHLASTQNGGDVARQIVGTPDVTAEHGDSVQAGAVDTYHGRVGVFVVDIGCYGTHTDAHGSNEDEGIEVIPALADILSADVFPLELRKKDLGNVPAFIAYGYDGYLLHLSMVMG